MTKVEFINKFNCVRDEFLNDPETEKLFISTIPNGKYTLEEIVPLIFNASIQMTAKFTFDVLSQVLEFDQE